MTAIAWSELLSRTKTNKPLVMYLFKIDVSNTYYWSDEKSKTKAIQIFMMLPFID